MQAVQHKGIIGSAVGMRPARQAIYGGTARSRRRTLAKHMHVATPRTSLTDINRPATWLSKYEYERLFIGLRRRIWKEVMVAGYDLHRCYGTPYGMVLEAQLIV
jgi:hypothetical protein